MTSIITHEIEERYPYPDNGERPVTQTRLGACLASRKAYGAGATRNPTDREIDMAALAIYTGTSGMSVEEVLPLWPDMNPDAWPKGQIALHLWAGCGGIGSVGQSTQLASSAC